MSESVMQAAKITESADSLSGPSKGQKGQSAFEAFEKIFDQAAKNLEEADQAALKVNTGEADLHDAMIAMEKADISLRMLVQVRNKAVDAYKEIMRMQV